MVKFKLPTLFKRENSTPSEVTYKICLSLLVLAVSIYSEELCRITFKLYFLYAFNKNLPIFDQAVWLISHGKTPFITLRGVHILGDHSSYILYLLAPLYWFYSDPRTLLTVQIVVLASGAFPIFFIALQQLKSAAVALLLSISFLAYAPLQWSNLYEFHPETLSTSLLIYSFYFYTKKCLWRYFISLFLAALTKEVLGPTIIVLGVYILWFDRKLGYGTIIFGIFALTVSLATMNFFSGNGGMPYLTLYSHLDGGLLSDKMTSCLNYFIEILFPLIFLSLLAPEILLIALPALLSNILSRRHSMLLINFHYTALITPYVGISAIYGFERVQKFGNRYIFKFTTALLSLITLFCLFTCPLATGYYMFRSEIKDSETQQIDSILNMIPANASLSICQSIASHSCHREKVFLFPNPFCKLVYGATSTALNQLEELDIPTQSNSEMQLKVDKSTIEYIALTPGNVTASNMGLFIQRKEDELLNNTSYGIISVDKNVLLLKRGTNTLAGYNKLRLFFGKKLPDNAKPQDVVNKWLGL